MPVLHKYKDRADYYILTKIQGDIITFQLTDEGQRRLQEAGISTGEKFPRALLLDLYRSGQAYTHGAESADFIDGYEQTILDLSNDPESEKMFPSCAICNSMNDLHFVEMKDDNHNASILCADCRSKKITTFDTSIPLTLVSRAILSRVMTMKEITKLDASIKAYKKLLDAEFESKWNEYRKRKPEQEVLIEVDAGNQGKLI